MSRRACVVGPLLAAILAGALSGCAVPAAPTGTGGSSRGAVTNGAAEGTAEVSGGVQRISVDLSQGVYDPAVIHAKAGVPLEITFGPGQGCTSAILIKQFGVNQDITQGAVIDLPAMKPGEYEFSCGMEMVFGKIVVR